MADQQTPKFTLEDVKAYLENSGALLEAEVLLSGYDKNPGNFDTRSPFTKREDSTLGTRLAVALGEDEKPADFGAVRDLKEVLDLHKYFNYIFFKVPKMFWLHLARRF
jgi:hypothetical protein